MTYLTLTLTLIQDLVYELDVLDRRFALLLGYFNHDTTNYFSKIQRAKDGQSVYVELDRLEFLFSEINRRKGDFRDFHRYRKSIQMQFGKKHDEFVDKFLGLTNK